MKPLYLTWFGRVSVSLLIGTVVVLSVAMSGETDDRDTGFNRPGNILITDQFNNRVIEIARDGTIVWQFGGGPNNVGPTAIVGTNDAERVADLTLMAGTGIPPGVTQASPACLANGCADNRVLLVNRQGKIVWQYGEFGVTGCGPDQLSVPVQNTYLSQANGDDHILITDQSNERIIEVRLSDKSIVWEFGQDNLTCSGASQLNNPNAAELLINGDILISDENNNRAIEVTHTMPSTIVATFSGAGGVMFSGVAFASRLPNGHTLVTDSNNSRIVETNAAGHVFWQFITNNRPGSNASPLPTRAVRLANGDTLISDQFNDQVIEVNSEGGIVATYGQINSPAFHPHDASVMNGPYSAYAIGDYTGMTPPF